MASGFLARLDPWVQFYCAGLIVLFLSFIAVMATQYRKVTRSASAALKSLSAIGPAHDDERRNGRSSESIERLRDAARKLRGGQPVWWREVDDAIERYESPETQGGQQRVGYFISRP